MPTRVMALLVVACPWPVLPARRHRDNATRVLAHGLIVIKHQMPGSQVVTCAQQAGGS